MSTTRTTSEANPLASSTTDDDAPRPQPGKGGRTGLKLVLGFLILAIPAAFLGGWIFRGRQMEEPLAQADARIVELGERLSTAESEKSVLEARLQEQATRLRHFELRRALYLAERSLTARNFGIAERHLREGDRMLTTETTAGGTGTRTSDWTSLQRDLAALQVTVSSDLAGQLEALRSITDRLDTLLTN